MWRAGVALVGLGLVGLALAPVGAGAASARTRPVTEGYDFNFVGGFSFDPSESVTNRDAYVQHLVLGGLFWYDVDGSLRPELAQGYTLESPTVLDITLRPNLQFQDGTPLTANEVKASIERSGSRTLSTSFRNEAVPVSGSKRATGTLQSIDVLSPTKLRFTETIPNAAQLLLVLGAMEGVIINPKQLADPSLKSAPIGAGPYKVVSYSPGSKLELAASDTYWDKKNVRVKDLTLTEVASTESGVTQGVNQVTTGALDYFNADLADTASVLAAARGSVKALVAPSDTQYPWVMVCKQPWRSLTAADVAGLADVNVRQAMNLMIDREALNKTLFDGKSESRTQNWRKGSADYDPAVAKAFGYDPKAAKQAMAKSAYPNGFSFTLVVNSNPVTDRLAEYLQQQWAQLGIKVDILKSLNISADWFQGLKGPAVLTYFIGVQGLKLTATYDSTRGPNSTCGYTGQDQYVSVMKATAPDAQKALTQLWKESAKKVAAEQSEIMTVWAPNQTLYSSSTFAKVAQVLDGLGSAFLDPTRAKLAS